MIATDEQVLDLTPLVWTNETRKLAELIPWPDNPRRIQGDQADRLVESFDTFGQVELILIGPGNEVYNGHQRLTVLLEQYGGAHEVEVRVSNRPLTQQERKKLTVFLHRGAIGEWDFEAFPNLFTRAELLDWGFTLPELDGLKFPELSGVGDGEGAGGEEGVEHRSLFERFIVPPFSILDARQGYWQERKRAWLALGIRSESGGRDKLKSTGSLSGTVPGYYHKKELAEARAGRKLSNEEFEQKYLADYLPENSQLASTQSGGILSIFDPVVCELVYRWFAPPGGSVLDPFAGGSVRGIVAARLGHPYTGVDLRPEQVEANREQLSILSAPAPAFLSAAVPEDYTPALTPIEAHGALWMKRDDLFVIAGVRGGKVRSCWALAQGALGLVTAGSRASPQVNIVAHIAQRLNLPCRVHTPTGELSPEVAEAKATGAEVVQHKAGYNNVIIARAREDAAARGWTNIPFGMECEEAVTQTRHQVADLPAGVKRIVMPVGSGMSLSGVLHGLADLGSDLPVLGVVVGADPTQRLDHYAPADWRDRVTLVPSGSDYHAPAGETSYDGVALDPHYEAKCVPFLQPGDLLWVVGRRQTAEPAPAELIPTSAPAIPLPEWITGDSRDLPTLLPAEAQYDLVFSCPPYFDLEVYSEDEKDLSNAGDYSAFMAAYREIIAAAVARLKPNRFAVFVVGDLRDKVGFYRNFVSDTVSAFQDAGALLYNDAVLITQLGSLPIRVAGQFQNMRKLGKSHQNVMVFYKGDPQAIHDFGSVEAGDIEPAPDDSAPSDEAE